ncbi:hypothetical protein ACIGB8_22675 [Promicromonospora sukumoe]|uniref:hypothetical protein n=1 Tax=Promicromonospora sukumoe TaxID=88382 RepID=UPI0037C8059E
MFSAAVSVETFAPLGDHLIGVAPDPSLIQAWKVTDGAHTIGNPARAIGQIPICWDPDLEAAREKAHEQFRWFAGGWQVNADLPTPAGFAGATRFVRPDDLAEAIPCGPDLDHIVEAVSAYWQAGSGGLSLRASAVCSGLQCPLALCGAPLMKSSSGL